MGRFTYFTEKEVDGLDYEFIVLLDRARAIEPREGRLNRFSEWRIITTDGLRAATDQRTHPNRRIIGCEELSV